MQPRAVDLGGGGGRGHRRPFWLPSGSDMRRVLQAGSGAGVRSRVAAGPGGSRTHSWRVGARRARMADGRSPGPPCLGPRPTRPCAGLRLPEPERWRNGTLVSSALTPIGALRGGWRLWARSLEGHFGDLGGSTQPGRLPCQLSTTSASAAVVNDATVPCLPSKETNVLFGVCVSEGPDLGTDGNEPHRLPPHRREAAGRAAALGHGGGWPRPDAPRAPRRPGRAPPRRLRSVLEWTARRSELHSADPNPPPTSRHEHLMCVVLPPLCHPSIFLTFLMHFKANCKHLHRSL